MKNINKLEQALLKGNAKRIKKDLINIFKRLATELRNNKNSYTNDETEKKERDRLRKLLQTIITLLPKVDKIRKYSKEMSF